MHTIRGRLVGVEYHNTCGLALLEISVMQADGKAYTATHIVGLMTYGSSAAAHARARRAQDDAVFGRDCELSGAALVSVAGQLWLMDMSAWHVKPGVSQEPLRLSVASSVTPNIAAEITPTVTFVASRHRNLRAAS